MSDLQQAQQQVQQARQQVEVAKQRQQQEIKNAEAMRSRLSSEQAARNLGGIEGLRQRQQQLSKIGSNIQQIKQKEQVLSQYEKEVINPAQQELDKIAEEQRSYDLAVRALNSNSGAMVKGLQNYEPKAFEYYQQLRRSSNTAEAFNDKIQEAIQKFNTGMSKEEAFKGLNLADLEKQGVIKFQEVPAQQLPSINAQAIVDDKYNIFTQPSTLGYSKAESAPEKQPSVVRAATTGEKVTNFLRRNVGIDVPSPKQAYRELFRKDMTEVEKVSTPISGNVGRDIFRTATQVPVMSETLISGTLKTGGYTGLTIVNPPSTQSQRIPVPKTETILKQETVAKVSVGAGELYAGGKVLSILGRTGGALATTSIGVVQGGKVYRQAETPGQRLLGVGIIAGSAVFGSMALKPQILKTVGERVVVNKVPIGRSIPGKPVTTITEQPTNIMIVKSATGETVAAREVYPFSSILRSESMGVRAAVTKEGFGVRLGLFSPTKVYSGVPYGAEKAGYKEAISLLKEPGYIIQGKQLIPTMGYTETQARSILRFTAPQQSVVKGAGTINVLYGGDLKEPVLASQGQQIYTGSQIIPFEKTYPSGATVTGFNKKTMQAYGYNIKQPGKFLGELKTGEEAYASVPAYSRFELGKVKVEEVGDFVTSYHGTTDIAAKNILGKGLVPAKVSKAGILTEVYTTPDVELAKGYAARSAFGKGIVKGTPEVLVIKQPIEVFESSLVKRTTGVGGAEEYVFAKVPKKYISTLSEQQPQQLFGRYSLGKGFEYPSGAYSKISRAGKTQEVFRELSAVKPTGSGYEFIGGKKLTAGYYSETGFSQSLIPSGRKITRSESTIISLRTGREPVVVEETVDVLKVVKVPPTQPPSTVKGLRESLESIYGKQTAQQVQQAKLSIIPQIKAPKLPIVKTTIPRPVPKTYGGALATEESIYAGKGLYEVTEGRVFSGIRGGLLTDTFIRTREPQILKPVSSFKLDEGQVQITQQKEDTGFRNIVSPISLERTRTTEETKLVQSPVEITQTRQVQETRQVQQQAQRITTRVTQETKIKTPPRPPRKKKFAWLDLPSAEIGTKSKIVEFLNTKKAYDVFIRRKGKELLIGKKLPVGLATKRGTEEVLGTLAASFTLKEAGTTSARDINFKAPERLFRPSKRLPGTLVQRKGGKEGGLGRLASATERREIKGFKRTKVKRFRL